MPSDLKVIQTNTWVGGMNSDIAPEYMPNDTYRYMLNCDVLSSAEGNVGIVVNPKGNVEIETPLPAGDNMTIGSANDAESNNFYFAVWNSEGYHTWYRFNSVDKTVLVVIQSRTDTSDIDIFNWQKGVLILHANVIANNLLYWTMEGQPPRKINVDKAMDKSDYGYGQTILEEYTRAYKRTSVDAPGVVYTTDETKKFNRLFGYQFKFVQRFLYDDGEKSDWSDWSNVPNPDRENFSGTLGVPLENNGIIVTLATGNDIVVGIELAMKRTNPEGGELPWVSVVTLDRDYMNIPSGGTYDYHFFNDGSYRVFSPEEELEVIRNNTLLPRDPLCQEFTKNSLLYSNFNEGRPPVDIDIDFSVRYEEIFIEDDIPSEPNNPEMFNSNPEGFRNGPWRSIQATLTVGPDVKKGNRFRAWFQSYKESNPNAGQTKRQDFVVEANLGDEAKEIATRMAAEFRKSDAFSADFAGGGWVGDVVPAGGGYYKFDFRMTNNAGWSYWQPHMDVNPVNTSTLKDNGQSVRNIKNGSSTKYGIVYRDEDGRKEPVYSTDAQIVPIDTVNALGGLMKPVVTLNINHRPPEWAKTYSIVRTKDLVYADYLQMLIQKVIHVEQESGDQYDDLVIGSLFTYQKVHPNTILQYEFKKGDRVRLIAHYEDDEYVVEEDVKDFEIISYQPTVSELIRQNVEVNGTDQVTVNQASEDRIGSFIIIEGVERQIISLSGNIYTVNAPISLDGATDSEPKKFPTYTLENRKGTIRIKSDPEYQFEDFDLVEIYTPAVGSASVNEKMFYEFGQRYDILDWGTPDARHAGSVQDQTASDPAVVEISAGSSYVRRRELPATDSPVDPQMVIGLIEDPNYSDFYVSDMTDDGKPNALDTGDGEVHFGSRVRFSNNYIEGTRINGLNNFDNLNREDYNDKYGDIMRILFEEGRLYVFKYLKDAWIPVYGNIITDQTGSTLLASSDKLIPNSLQYFLWDGGVGSNPESVFRSGNNVFHVSPNSGIIARIGGGGVEPISITYGLDKAVREHLQSAQDSGAKMKGGFNRRSDSYLLAIEAHDQVVYNTPFTGDGWATEDPPVVDIGPYVDAGPDQSIVGSTIFTDGTVTPGSSAIVSVLWEQVSGPTTATISNPGIVDTQISDLEEGTYVFRLTAMDLNEYSNSDEMSITVSVVSARVYYGNSDSIVKPDLSTIENSDFVNFVPGADFTIPFDNESTPKFSWIAYPTSEPIKTKWEDRDIPVNNGSIGTEDDLFGPYSTVASYRVTITQYATEFENPIIFKQ